MRGNMRRNYVVYKGVKRMNYAIRNAEREMSRVEINNTNQEVDQEAFYYFVFGFLTLVTMISTMIYLIVVS